MDKRRLHYLWTKVRVVRPWYFLLLAVISGIVCVHALISNNQTMGVLRADVFQADKNNGDVNTALKNLQQFVTSHMNTNLQVPNGPYPPIQLQYTYQRLQAEAVQKVSSTNQQLYTDAENYCQQQDPVDFSGHNRVPCVEKYVQSHGINVPTIPAALYEFNFISPPWTPDVAGWSLAVTVLFSLLFIIVLAADFWLKRRIR